MAFDISVLNTPVLTTDLTVSGGKIVITGIGENFAPEDVDSYTRTAYAAGTLGVWTIDMTGTTLRANSGYKVTITRQDPANTARSYTWYSGSTAPADVAAIVTALAAQINNDTGRLVDATTSTDDLILTQIAVGYDNIPTTDENVDSITATVANVMPSGRVADVIALGAPASETVATANYTTYSIIYRRRAGNDAVGGALVQKQMQILVFADELDAGYTAFNAGMNATFSNTGLDKLKQDGTPGMVFTTTAVAVTLTRLNFPGVLMVTGTATPFTITLPLAADAGAGMLFISNLADDTVTFAITGSDTLTGTTVATLKRAWLMCNGVDNYWLYTLD